MVAAIFPEELADITSAEEKKRIIQILRYLDFKITDDNKKTFYDNIRDYTCFKKPSLLREGFFM